MKGQPGRPVPYKLLALKAAEELGYGDKVLEQIKQTNNDDAIIDIMRKERKRRF